MVSLMLEDTNARVGKRQEILGHTVAVNLLMLSGLACLASFGAAQGPTSRLSANTNISLSSAETGNA